MRKHVIALAVLGSLFVGLAAFGEEPGWEGGIIRFGAEREKIRNTHILDRPYRPFHVYGNAVRRRYYRARSQPFYRTVQRNGGR